MTDQENDIQFRLLGKCSCNGEYAFYEPFIWLVSGEASIKSLLCSALALSKDSTPACPPGASNLTEGENHTKNQMQKCIYVFP